MDVNKAYHLIMDKLTTWMDELIRMLPNIFLAAIALVLGFFVAKKLRSSLQKLSNDFLIIQH